MLVPIKIINNAQIKIIFFRYYIRLKLYLIKLIKLKKNVRTVRTKHPSPWIF